MEELKYKKCILPSRDMIYKYKEILTYDNP
jgi:hypothetical protein